MTAAVDNASNASIIQREGPVSIAGLAIMVTPQDAIVKSVYVITWGRTAANAPPGTSACVTKQVGSASVFLTSRVKAVTVVVPTFGTWQAEKGVSPAIVTPTTLSA